MSDTELKYGFRYDPISWIDNDGSVRGALARLNFLNEPRDGDEAIVDVFIREHLANIESGDAPVGMDAAIWGLPLDHERLRQRAVEWLDAVRLRRFGGAVLIVFTRPRRAKLSPADWVDGYQTQTSCRTIPVDPMEGGDRPQALESASVSYVISAVAAPPVAQPEHP